MWPTSGVSRHGHERKHFQKRPPGAARRGGAGQPAGRWRLHRGARRRCDIGAGGHRSGRRLPVARPGRTAYRQLRAPPDAPPPGTLGRTAGAAGITRVFDALGVGEIDAGGLRSRPWNRVLDSIDACTERRLLRAEHHLHVRCELPAPNTIDLFAPFHGHPRLTLISLMDHTPGQRQWENLAQARTYYTGRKGWSDEKFERQVLHAATLQERYAAPHRAYFVDYCRANGIALASHDDTTVAHVEQAHAEGAALSEFPTTLAAARAAHERGLLTVMGGPNVV